MELTAVEKFFRRCMIAIREKKPDASFWNVKRYICYNYDADFSIYFEVERISEDVINMSRTEFQADKDYIICAKDKQSDCKVVYLPDD